jgi:membrane-bound serine protease (ClpP class)
MAERREGGSGPLLRVGVALVVAGVVVVPGGVSSGWATPLRAGGDRPVVYEVSITGPVDPSVARLVERGMRVAGGAHAAAILVRLDTPGGLDSSMREIIKSIQGSRVPVVCWVGPPGARAASAGTFILIGCPLAAMAPGTNVGAAHPVGLTGGTLSEKVTNDAAAYIRSLAESRGRNAGWAERAVRQSVSISAPEALDIHVVDLLAPSVPALLRAVDGRRVDTAAGARALAVADARVTSVELTPGERLLHGLSDPNLAFLFFVFGLAGLVFEMLHPGLNLPGVIGLILLVLSLVLFGSLPVNIAGVLLLAAAFVFFVIDLKVGAHGVPTFAGLVSFVLGGLFLYDRSVPNARVSRPLLIGMAVALATFFFFVVRAGLRARKAPVVSGAEGLVGEQGLVIEALKPRGHVRVRSELWAATLARDSGEIVPPAARVRVLAIQGLTLVVEPVGDVGDESDAGSTKSEVTP